MDELHSRWASPPQAAFCAAVNAAAGSEANDAIRASPKKVAIAIVGRFSDILFFVFCGWNIDTLACIDWKSIRLRTRWSEGRKGLGAMTVRLMLLLVMAMALGGCQNPSRIQAPTLASSAAP